MLCRTYLPFLHSTHHTLNVIHARQINNIVAIKNNLASQLTYILTNLGMLNHHNNHIDIRQEGIQIVVLVFRHVLGDEWVIDL